jgi:tetratricopeptide (TPR) repeat protein
VFSAFGMPCYTISPKGARAFKTRCFPLRPMVVHIPEGLRAPPHCEHFRTVGFDNTMNNAYRHLNSFVCFPPLVVAQSARAPVQIATEVPSAATECRRGDALARENRLEEALACYDRALAVDPGHAEALNNRGMALHRLKRLDEALLSFDRMLVLNRHIAEIHFNRGAVLQELNRLTEALSSYDLMLTLKPDFVPALNNRALVLWHMQRYDAALASCDRALAVKPDDPSALRNREFILHDVRAAGEKR